MGLLDDAIREHLELKRLHGADPGQVAREERDALGPVHRGQEPEKAEQVIDAQASPQSAARHPSEASKASPSEDFANVGQETAELDMRSVLGDETPRANPDLPDSGQDTPATAEDSLEWEAPRERSASGSSGEEPADPSIDDAEGSVEDVLEATPDFLRETPEQERLWFEQRPPRDFDFDK